ncbi:PQQ-dependent sugar dehydrogenase [Salisediminibacterium selenitireducens]|uniref:Glucose sorbosone dehydrogenase n=1 Tax=Bacillus selenitireducens (strain ATCC 700615 / DSM 15326 / MLS10) TaxID=439292 RepID=D6XYL9_BACIE|nr:PQQ-dependent sugar dehydrogenase [Salisediminibacterium selenitireducens]ADH98177.1 glucose sorbosone dehydrogenase [[Bacillus] selenitireducens MLS10]
MNRLYRFLAAVTAVPIIAACADNGGNEPDEPTIDVENEANGESEVNDNVGVDTEDEAVNEHGGNNGENEVSGEEANGMIPIAEMTTGDWTVETVAESLDVPWSLQKADSVYYLTDRDGHVLEVTDGDVSRFELETSDPVAHEGEGGLLGFLLSEDFASSGEGFAYYTYQGPSALENRVVTVERQNGAWVETDILLDGISGDRIHNGGRLAVGPDDHLYVTTGDANVPSLSQDENNLAGKILRMTQDGEVPDDNPFGDSYVYSTGHRNPQGLSWLSNGTMYASEHGPTAQDEINLIEPGNNYGWPEIEGDESAEGMEDPAIHSGTDTTWAPSGTAVYDDYLLVTGLRGSALYLYDEAAHEMREIFDGEGRLRDVYVDGDSIYVLTNNTDGRGNPAPNDDRILRLTWNGEQ